MLKKALIVAIAFATSVPAWAQSGQLGANQIWGNPTGASAPSRPSNIGSFLTQGTGLTISGTPKATIGITSTIVAAGPSGSATQTPVITYNAQGQLTVVSLATIAPPFTAITGSLACSQRPALTGFVTSPAGSCATSLGATITIAQGGTGQITAAAAISAIMPTPTRAGDVAFWNGSNWVTLAGNNSGTQILSENSTGVPAWQVAGTGTVTSVVCGTGLSGGTITTSGTCAVSLTNASNIIGADVLMNNTANYFDGPSMAQGTSGSWFVSGTVTFTDTAGSAFIFCKLWDGTTVISSTGGQAPATNVLASVSLHGILASPAANIRISCRDATSTSGKILFNNTGNSKDSSIWGFRIQ